jgi:hypothetical protein
MRLITIRWYLLLLAGLTAAPVQAQQPTLIDSTTMNFKDALGNLWSRKQTRSTIRRALPTVSVTRDIQLRRFKTSAIPCPAVPAGDTLRISIMNKSGAPLKKIRCTLDQTTLLELQDTVGVQYEKVLPQAGTPTIYLQPKPSLGLHAQVASVKLQHTPPAKLDTLYANFDVLLKKGRTNARDSIVWQSAAPGKGAQLLTKWSGQIKTAQTGEHINRSKTLSTKTHPPLLTVLQAPQMIRLRNWKTDTVPIASEFIKGDTLIFSIKAFGKTKLSSCELQDQDAKVLGSALDFTDFSDTLVIRTEKKLRLFLKPQLSLRKKYAQLSVLRIRPVATDTFYQVIDSTFRTTENTLYDTLVLTVFDDSLELAPIWNIEQTPYGEFKVDLPVSGPKLGQLAYIVYWLGIGRAAINEFQQLETSVPPDWSRPGASVPLGALGFGHQLAFLQQPAPEVSFACTNLNGRDLFKAGKTIKTNSVIPNLNKQNYGVADYCQTSTDPKCIHSNDIKRIKDPKTGIETLAFYTCFRNKSTVDPFPVALKIVGFYRQKKKTVTTTQLLKIENYQEPVRK